MKNKQPKISEILHLAADKYVWDGVGARNGKSEYSCDAILSALMLLNLDFDSTNRLRSIVSLGLWNMGLDNSSYIAFNEFEYGPKRQAARYAWLKFAAMIAEEQGV